MTIILDTGAFLTLERRTTASWRRVTNALNTGVPPLTHGGVIAQVWRGGHGRQARVAQALKGVTVEPLDDELGRAAGILLARAGMTDAIDAAVVSLAEDGDRILTSDPVAIDRLVEAAGLDVEVVPV